MASSSLSAFLSLLGVIIVRVSSCDAGKRLVNWKRKKVYLFFSYEKMAYLFMKLYIKEADPEIVQIYSENG